MYQTLTLNDLHIFCNNIRRLPTHERHQLYIYPFCVIYGFHHYHGKILSVTLFATRNKPKKDFESNQNDGR